MNLSPIGSQEEIGIHEMDHMIENSADWLLD